MKVITGRSSVIITLASLLFIFIFFMAFAPTQLGGAVTYVIVDGNSMEPGFFRGDLVLVRVEPAYGVGDAVIYQDPNMGSFVFHRIIGLELDHFILQGDNNSWLDSYQPTQGEIVGKLWVHIPKLGRAIEWVRVPLHMSLTVGLMGGVLMFDMIKKPSQRRKKEQKMPSGNFGRMPEGALYVFGFLALLFLVLGIYSFTRPLNRSADNISYQQDGYYYYSATGTPGVYDTDVVRSGEPVFPKLTCFLNVGYTYNVTGGHLQGISGTHAMSARIMDEQSGWSRTIPLNTETSFVGNSYFTMATLDLCQIESLVNLVEQEAGLNQTAYTLEISANAAITASVGSAQISDSFSPRLVFKYDKVHFYLITDKSQSDDPLRSSKQGIAGGATSQPNTISILGLKPAVWIIRVVSLIGFAFSLLGLIGTGMNVYRTASQSQDALIRLKYGGMLVDVYEQNLAPSSSVIDVATMDDLARLAERQGTMILHMTRNFLHYYFVQSNGTTYRYVISAGRKGAVETEAQADVVSPHATPVVQEPAFVPETIHREVPARTVSMPMKKKVPASPVKNVQAQPVIVPAKENNAAVVNPLNGESIEYVINTGEIEFSMHPTETIVLRKIKL
jgi:signal peptidase I